MSRAARARQRWRAARARYHWLDHIAVAGRCYLDHDGNHYAAAITYFSFLALFPLLLLAVSVTGFVLNNNVEAEQKLLDKITENIPGNLGQSLKESVNAAINARASIGLIGLAGLIFTGLVWVGRLRAAINAMWGLKPEKRGYVRAKGADLVVLVGLGIGVLATLLLTVVGTAFTDRLLRVLGLNATSATHVLVQALGIALALVGDLVIAGWLLVGLPRVSVPIGVVVRAALLGAVGFEMLKVVGTYYISRVTQSPTAGIFGSVIGILIWIDLVSRYVLYCAAWAATAHPGRPATMAAAPAEAAEVLGLADVAGSAASAEVGGPAEPAEVAEPAAATAAVPAGAGARRRVPWPLSPVGLAVSLFSAGAAAGGGAVAWLAARRRGTAAVTARPAARRLADTSAPAHGRGDTRA